MKHAYASVVAVIVRLYSTNGHAAPFAQAGPRPEGNHGRREEQDSTRETHAATDANQGQTGPRGSKRHRRAVDKDAGGLAVVARHAFRRR